MFGRFNGSVVVDSSYVGDTSTFAVIAIASDGKKITGMTVEFSSGNTNAATPISSTAITDNSGLAKMKFVVKQAGAVTLTAKAVNVSVADEARRSYQLTLPISGPPTSIRIAPRGGALPVNGRIGLVARLYDAEGRSSNTSSIQFLALDSGKADFIFQRSGLDVHTGDLAAVNASDITTLVANQAGTARVSATSRRLPQLSDMITFEIASIGSITLMASADVVVGGQVQLTAVVRDPAGTVLTGAPVTWTSSNPTVASLADANGKVNGIASGAAAGKTQQATITANAGGGVSATSVVTVYRTPGNVLVTPSLSLNIADTGTVNARFLDTDGITTIPLSALKLTWSIDQPGIASVTPLTTIGQARVTGSAAGTTQVRAKSDPVCLAATCVSIEGVSAVAVKGRASVATTIDLFVAAGTTTRPVAPTGETVALNGTLALQAVVRDQTGTVLAEAVKWSSSNPVVAVVDAVTGVVTAKSAGTATVVATSSSVATVSSSVAILVSAPPGSSIPTAIILTPWVATTGIGQTTVVTAKVVDASGAATTCQLGFAIDRSAVGSVTSSGSTATVTGIGLGTTALRAYCNDYGSVVALARLTVIDAQYPVAQVKITPRFVYFPASTAVSSFQFAAATLDRAGATITAPVAWAASNPAITVDQTGKVSVPASTVPAVGGGGIITATAAGQTDVAWVTFGNAGTIRGQVISTAGQYVGVTSAWAVPSSGGAMVATTTVNSDGYFYLVGLAPGSYTVVVNPTTTAQQQYPNVTVTAAQQTVVTVAPLASRVSGGASATRP